jgi:hypothetical protein
MGLVKQLSKIYPRRIFSWSIKICLFVCFTLVRNLWLDPGAEETRSVRCLGKWTDGLTLPPHPQPSSLHLQKPGVSFDRTLREWIFYFHWTSGGCLSQDNHTIPLWEAQNVFRWWSPHAVFRFWRQRRRDCKCTFLLTVLFYIFHYST